MEFINNLKERAYKDLDIQDHHTDLHGWISQSFDEVVKESVKHLEKQEHFVVVEVGTWKGLSATRMATILKEMGFTNFNIICIDTWLGAPEFWTWGALEAERGKSLKCVNGFPSVFYTFTKNVKALGLQDVIAPLPLSSTQAAEVLQYYKIIPSLIYIDASHEFLPVSADLSTYYPLLKEGCVMFGDDYSPYWKGVVESVNMFSTYHKLDVGVKDVVWSIKKP
jgi:hypothetical protein